MTAVCTCFVVAGVGLCLSNNDKKAKKRNKKCKQDEKILAAFLNHVDKIAVKEMAEDAEAVKDLLVCTEHIKECEDRLILLAGSIKAAPTS